MLSMEVYINITRHRGKDSSNTLVEDKITRIKYKKTVYKRNRNCI